MSLSDLASLSKVMELPDGSVEYGYYYNLYHNTLVMGSTIYYLRENLQMENLIYSSADANKMPILGMYIIESNLN